MNLKVSFFLFLFLLGYFLHAQNYSHQYNKIFPDANQYKQNGWLFGAGLSYTVPPLLLLKKKQETQFDFSPKGKFGFIVELGRFYLLEYSTLFKFLDYGLSYKKFKGIEKYKEKNGVIQGENLFSSHYVSFHFNLNRVFPTSDYNFIMNTVGVNGDYLFAKKIKYTSPVASESIESFIFQLHYKFAYGMNVANNLIIIPNIEIPILNVYAFDNGMSSLGFFNSRYHPFLFKITFLLFSFKGYDECPPVYGPGVPMDNQQQGY